MVKSELIQRIADTFAIPSSVTERIVKSMLDAMVRELASGGSVQVRGLGTFSLRLKRARMGRNPRTGAVVQVSAKHSVRFKAGRELNKRINQ